MNVTYKDLKDGYILSVGATTRQDKTLSSITDPSSSDCAVILKLDDGFSAKIVEPKKAIKVKAKHIKL